LVFAALRSGDLVAFEASTTEPIVAAATGVVDITVAAIGAAAGLAAIGVADTTTAAATEAPLRQAQRA